MNWAMMTVGAAFFYAIVGIIDKFIIGHDIRDPVFVTTVMGIVTFVLLGAISLFMGHIMMPVHLIIVSMSAGMIFRGAVILYFEALQKGEISSIAPVMSTKSIFLIIFAMIFLGEHFPILTYFGIGFITLGVALISYERKKVMVSWAVMIAIGTAALFAIRTILVKYVVLTQDVWSPLFWFGLGNAVIAGFLLFTHHSHVFSRAREGMWLSIVSVTLNTVAFVLLTMALVKGPATLVGSLAQLEILFVFILALGISFFHPDMLHERLNEEVIVQKGLAVFLVIAGALMIV
ncbi:MAG: EamA family transporter [Nanoarchaeota archaeon]